MIHIRIDGTQFNDNGLNIVRLMPYTADVGVNGATVGTVQQTLGLNVGTTNKLITFRNVSTAGQIIGLGNGALVTLNDASILLYPGESIQLSPVDVLWTAIASAAGAFLKISALRTA